MNALKKINSMLIVIAISSAISVFSVLITSAMPVFAGGQPDTSTQTTPADSSSNRPRSNDCKANLNPENCGITRYIILLINVLSATLGVVITAVIVVAGIQYSASGDNPQATAAAKKRITNAILSMVLFVAMYGFLQWIVPGGVL
jgi:hypothetical protein